MTCEPEQNTNGPSALKRGIWFAVALAAMGLILALPTARTVVEGDTIELTAAGKATLAVLAVAVLLWMTEAIPFPVTGLLSLVLLVMTGAMPLKQLVADGFGNRIILFFIGVLIFSAALSETNLLKRLTAMLLFHVGHKPKVVILLFLTVGMLLSGWITDMAVAAILLPIGVSVLRDAKLEPLQSNFGRALMISCAWGPLCGGVATPAGCGPNPLTMAFLRDLAQIEFSFLDWMLIGYPAAIVMVPCAWAVLLLVFPIEKGIDLRIDRETYDARLAQYGRIEWREVATMIIFALTVFLWIAGPWIEKQTGIEYLSIHFVAIGGACLFFLPGIDAMTWKKAEASINWGGIILIVSGLALGMATYKTGAAEWLATVCFSRIADLHPVGQIFAVVFGVSLMKVMFSSNTVTGTIVVPLLIALAQRLGIDPIILAVPAGITASLAFILVTSTPTNVIPYSSGYFTIQDMAKAGLIMTVLSSICVTASIAVFGPMFDIVNW